RDKARKSEMLADEDVRLAFFDQRVPASVTSGKGFEAWREQAERRDPKILHLQLADVLGSDEQLDPRDYPDELMLHGVKLPRTYRSSTPASSTGPSRPGTGRRSPPCSRGCRGRSAGSSARSPSCPTGSRASSGPSRGRWCPRWSGRCRRRRASRCPRRRSDSTPCPPTCA